MRILKLGRIFAAALLLGGTVVVAPACAAPQGRLYVQAGPPPPLYEARVVAPGPGYVWVPGYHAWSGRAYVWKPGAWVRPPHAGARWAPSRWEKDRRGWYQVEGRWH